MISKLVQQEKERRKVEETTSFKNAEKGYRGIKKNLENQFNAACGRTKKRYNTKESKLRGFLLTLL